MTAKKKPTPKSVHKPRTPKRGEPFPKIGQPETQAEERELKRKLFEK